jgi:CelD/BcsL family acetyltransferase involved in cellulose biosynthesis
VGERDALLAAKPAWDELAVACSRPFCAFDWLLGWWEEDAPARATLAVVLVHDAGGRLVGVAPGYCDRGPARTVRWRPLAAPICQHVEPFALPDLEAEAAHAIARALHAHRPRPQLLSFEGIRERSPWPGLLADAWPRKGPRPAQLTVRSPVALVLDLTPGFDRWFAGKRSHFRQRLRRAQREADAAGACFRLADAASAAADLESFLRLHVGRWEGRGGTHAVPASVAAILRSAGPRLVEEGFLRIWSLDLDGTTIASSLVFDAGDRQGYWLNGFDADHARLEPSKLSILHVVRDAFARGATRLDLGEGDLPHKRRFTDEEEILAHVAVAPWSPRFPQVALDLAPQLARRFAAQRLSDETKDRLRRVRRTGASRR